MQFLALRCHHMHLNQNVWMDGSLAIPAYLTCGTVAGRSREVGPGKVHLIFSPNSFFPPFLFLGILFYNLYGKFTISWCFPCVSRGL